MTNTDLHYMISRAITMADLGIDTVFYSDFQKGATETANRMAAIFEFLKQDLKQIQQFVSKIDYQWTAKSDL